MYGGFQGGPQLGPPDAERRQSLGQQMLERWAKICNGCVRCTAANPSLPGIRLQRRTYISQSETYYYCIITYTLIIITYLLI